MVFNVLKRRQFRRFFFSDVISGFGVGMSTIGANWYLMDQLHSIAAVGVMLSINVIAGFVISPLIGSLIDRFNRKSIIFWTHAARAILILGITGLLAVSGFRVEYLYLFTIINGMGWTVYMSASRSFVQELLPEKELIHGNSLVEISLQVGMFMAGTASGILYKYFGFEMILFLNAVAFIVSSLILTGITYSPISKESEEESFYASFQQGIRYLAARPNVFWMGTAGIIPLVATMVYNVVLPGYVLQSVGGDSVVFGLSDMSYGIGGLLSGFVAAPLARKLSQNGAITLFFLMAGAVLLGVAFNTYVFGLYAGSVFIGLSISSLRILINTTLMEKVSKAFMGRAMSVWIAISLFLQAVSAPGLGLLTDHVSPSAGFMCMSGIMVFGFVLYAVFANRGAGKSKQTLDVS